YSMPIWASVLAWLILGDKLDRVRLGALGLCITGLPILVWPLFAAGLPLGVFFALGSAFAWTTATVYMKWAKVDVDPLINAAWQLLIGTALITIRLVIFEGQPRVWPISARAALSILYIGLFGVGLA